jgi:hypothetical protein
MTDPQVYTVFWGSSWASQSAITSEVESSFASLGGTTYQQRMGEYCINSEAGQDIWQDGYTDSSAPASTISLGDAAAELDAVIDSRHWPGANLEDIYFLYLPPGTTVQGDTTVCGVHSFTGSDGIIYAVIPWPSNTYANGDCRDFGVDVAIRLTVDSSHEYVESATDPVYSCSESPASAYITWSGSCSNGPMFKEIGDACVGPASNTSFLPGTAGFNAESSIVQWLWVDSSSGGSCEAEQTNGYWFSHTPGGGTSRFGDAQNLSCSTNQTNDPDQVCPTSTTGIVGIAGAPYSDLKGYYEADAAGDVWAFGPGAFWDNDLPDLDIQPAHPIVGIAVTQDGNGYWLVGSDGGIFAFGDATYYGSCPANDGCRSVRDIVGMYPTSDSGGYWLVGADGGVFGFGDADYFGSEAGQLNAGCQAVGLAGTWEDNAWWMLDDCNNIYAKNNGHGDAGTYECVGCRTDLMGGLVPARSGEGYFLWSTVGNLYGLGDAIWRGSDAGAGDTEAGFALTS